MKNERILSYKMSQKLSVEDIQDISAAGWTSMVTAGGTRDRHGNSDDTWDNGWDG